MSATSTSTVYEFTSENVPGWNNLNNRWVAIEVLLSVIGLFVVLYFEWKNKEIKLAGNVTKEGETNNREAGYVDSEDDESEPPAPSPPDEDNPGRLAEGTTSTTKHYFILQEFWLLLTFHSVSLVAGMRHSAQGLGVLFAYIHFLIFGAFVFFHVNDFLKFFFAFF